MLVNLPWNFCWQPALGTSVSHCPFYLRDSAYVTVRSEVLTPLKVFPDVLNPETRSDMFEI